MRKLFTIILSTLLTASCNDAFDTFIEGSYLKPTPVVNGEGSKREQVAITPTFNAQQFVAMTRGAGPLDSWTQSETKWRNADIRIYALRDGVQFNQSADTDDCLLWNESAKVINASGDLKFSSGEKYYNNGAENSYYKYNFYCNYVDDEPSKPYVTADGMRIVQNVDFSSGERDYMVGFAYNTDAEINEQIEKNKEAGFENEETRLIASTADKSRYTYGYVSGRNGIQPYFALRKLTTRLDIRVRGKYDKAYPGVDKYRGIIIDYLALESAKTGLIVLADASWNRDNFLTQPLENLISTNNDASLLEAQIREQEDSEERTKYLAELAKKYKFNPKKVWQINSDEGIIMQVTNDVMVPVQQKYYLHLGYYYVDFAFGPDGKPDFSKLLGCYYYRTNQSPTDYKPIEVVPSAGKKFEGGSRQSILLNFIVPLDIKLQVGMSEWADGGDFKYDMDDMETTY